jgi:sugar lactone lactonase YvrE
VLVLTLATCVMAAGVFTSSAAGAGSVLWTRRARGETYASYDSAHAVAVSPGGARVFITGGTGDSYLTIAYRAVSGAKIWAASYDGPGNADGGDFGNSLAVSPDGSTVFVTGESAGSGTDADYATVAYDAATGAEMWAARHGGPAGGYDSARSLGVSPDGSRVFITGESAGSGTDADYNTIAYDAATGAEAWAARYDGPASGYDAAHALAVSPDGSTVFVTGGSAGNASRSDFATVAYHASAGARVWTRRLDGPTSRLDYGAAVAVSPDGRRVYVTGTSVGRGTSSDYATIAYASSTGATTWSKRYDGPVTDTSWDNPHAIAVSPDGSEVVVTGESNGGGTGQDYATVAYTA